LPGHFQPAAGRVDAQGDHRLSGLWAAAAPLDDRGALGANGKRAAAQSTAAQTTKPNRTSTRPSAMSAAKDDDQSIASGYSAVGSPADLHIPGSRLFPLDKAILSRHIVLVY
jgi:hypothetical protein